jgi:hypothetical protein
MFAIFILCLIGIAVAQPPSPCTTPPQWEANVFDINGQQKLMVRGRLSYDATNHRERIIEEVDVGRQNSSYDIISWFDSKMEYIYDFNTRNCTRRPITRPWRNFGIRPDARSYGEAFIGTSAVLGANIFVTMW